MAWSSGRLATLASPRTTPQDSRSSARNPTAIEPTQRRNEIARSLDFLWCASEARGSTEAQQGGSDEQEYALASGARGSHCAWAARKCLWRLRRQPARDAAMA
jgi:hypothetical protein